MKQEEINWECFEKRIIIHKNIKTVFNAWTTSNQLEKWFLKKSQFYSSNNTMEIPKDVNVKSKSNYSWNWFAQNHSETGTVLKVLKDQFIEFTFAGNCLVTVELSVVDENNTLVTLTQKNIPTDNVSKQNIRLGCAFGWTFYLLNLKSVLEGGIDLRNKNSDLKNVINN